MKKIVFVLLLFVSQQVVAQTLYYSSNSFLNKTSINSALAGYSGNIEAFISSRRIYNGLPNPYYSNYASFQTGFTANNGLYAHVYNENFGVFTKTSLQLAFGQRVRLSKDVVVGVGINVNGVINQVNLSNVILENYDDQLIKNFNATNSLGLNFGLSAFADIKGWILGISASNILTQSGYNSYSTSYTGLLSKKLRLGNILDYDFTGVLSGSNSYKLDFFLNNRLIFNQNYWLNVGYKTGNNISVGGGLTVLQRYAINYSYTMLLPSISVQTLSTHEITLGILIKRDKKSSRQNISIFNQRSDFQGVWNK